MIPSTFSANDRLRPARWLRTWLVAVAIAILLLSGWEGLWRFRGFTPRQSDDLGGWVRQRAKVSVDGSRSVVLVGSSRLHCGFNPEVFAAATGIHPIQLALDGDSGFGVLRDLANDSSFRGTVIVDLAEKDVGSLGSEADAVLVREWLAGYHTSNPYKRLEWWTRTAAQRTFVFRLPELSASNLIANLPLDQLPVPTRMRFNADRSEQVDFDRPDLPLLRARNVSAVRDEYDRMRAITPEEFVAQGRQLAIWSAEIDARGGRVIFVRFPASVEVRKLEDERFPKALFWDALMSAEQLKAIHCLDYDSLKGFSCPDGTHLDYRDAERFTAALTEILIARKWLPD